VKIYLIRHGETATDNPEKCYGATDIDLSPKGYRQAEQIAARFTNENITSIYSSTLKRGINTAATIAKSKNIKVEVCPELNEVNFGQIEGLTFTEACVLFPEVTEAWGTNSADLCFPLGESVTQFRDRVISFLPRLKNYSDGDTILVVGHGGPFRILLCQLLGMDIRHFWQFRLDMASISQISIYKTGAMLEKLSDLSHLDSKTGGEQR
jgi:alpha-ribazole phosphatase